MDKDYLLKETIVMLSADLYGKIYERDEFGSYTDAAREIISLAEQFEKELDWQEDDERDYIKELESFERKVLNKLSEDEK